VAVNPDSPAAGVVHPGDVVIAVASKAAGSVSISDIDQSPDLSVESFETVLAALRAAARHVKGGGEALVRFFRPDEDDADFATPPDGYPTPEHDSWNCLPSKGGASTIGLGTWIAQNEFDCNRTRSEYWMISLLSFHCPFVLFCVWENGRHPVYAE